MVRIRGVLSGVYAGVIMLAGWLLGWFGCLVGDVLRSVYPGFLFWRLRGCLSKEHKEVFN